MSVTHGTKPSPCWSKSPCANAISHQIIPKRSQLHRKDMVKMMSVWSHFKSTRVVKTSCKNRPCSRMLVCATLQVPFLATNRAFPGMRAPHVALQIRRSTPANSLGGILLPAPQLSRSLTPTDTQGRDEPHLPVPLRIDPRPPFLCYLSARTKEVKTLSSLASRAWGLSYSRMMPRFITITRSAFRMSRPVFLAVVFLAVVSLINRSAGFPGGRCRVIPLTLTVAMSMDAVASSMMRMLLFLTKARARQNSCR
ncbi:hypothetical protein EYF80_029983 [Liparis tanakae]|uniref:Uncharacterized protein n=1 Tax=Liparis tanakae TaxID=230148 RepID=A0A4Z2H1Q7_9TELE|nr:hypothetical protein EYF80_029983 [Liparis tanakae]